MTLQTNDTARALVFTEALDLSEARFDADNRTLTGVILIRAGLSKNRRRYSEKVLAEAAPVFEGAKAYDSHEDGGRERPVGALTGWYSGVRYSEGALRADRHFTRTRAGNDVLAVVEDMIAGRAPATLAGLSINAVGTGRKVKEGDEDVVEVDSITAARSVDDVANPAAGGSYLALAASGGNELLSALLAALSYEEWFNARPEYLKRAQNEMKVIRQDEAVKAAKAEADTARLAAADAEGKIREAQTDLETERAQNAKLLSALTEARRDLAVATALRGITLPQLWEQSLRDQLTAADPNDWAAILDTELAKAKHAPPAKARPVVTGAGVMVARPFEAAAPSPRPRDDEDVEAWSARMGLKGN